tara:strand:+ start:3927 stop:4340 length:414 start_codon:yes stop_codon:yes gene_type:complete
MSNVLPVSTTLAALVLAVTPVSACPSVKEAMPVSSQIPAVAAPIGLWDIRPAERGTSDLCRLALRGEAEGDGKRVVLGTCTLKAAAGTHHWRVTPTGFRLVDADGATLITFTPQTEDVWIGVGADGREYRMSLTAMY